MHEPIPLLAAILFAVIGLSHLLQPLAWVEFFIALREQGRAGVLFEGFLHLFVGAPIVAFYGLRPGLPMVLGVVGVLLVLKAAVRFLAPALVLRQYARLVPAHARLFRAGGVFALALGALFLHLWWVG